MLSFSLCHSTKCSVHIVSTTEMCELTASHISVFGNYSGRNNIYVKYQILLALEMHAYFWNRSKWVAILFIDSLIPITYFVLNTWLND